MLRIRKILLFWAALALLPSLSCAADNARNYSFNKSKWMLSRQVYFDHRITVYCSAPYDKHNTIALPEGFTTSKYHSRAKRMEWEHIVPAENFGRAFREWRKGDPVCVDTRGKPFKGRNCASKVNMEYRSMQATCTTLLQPSAQSMPPAKTTHLPSCLTRKAPSDLAP
jgi:deoxyribonuclease-1